MNYLATVIGLLALAATAESSPASAPSVEILPRTCETELALAAAPEHLRAEAGVYVLTAGGYELARPSRNGFACIVNRDHPRVLKPTCFDPEGVATIVPKIVAVGAWLLEGLAAEEIGARVEQAFEEGTFRRAGRPGVAYMLSNYNRPWNPGTGELGFFPPHVMFYAPDVTNEDIGHVAGAHRVAGHALPFVGYQGPHGYMIMVTGENRPRAEGELSSCPEWVWR